MSGQRILKQPLHGSIEECTKKATWTWKEGEVAYYISDFYGVQKVKFTGKHWVTGYSGRWSPRDKVYQYEVLTDTSANPVHRDRDISHARESEFFEDFSSAIKELTRQRINKTKNKIQSTVRELENFQKDYPQDFPRDDFLTIVNLAFKEAQPKEQE